MAFIKKLLGVILALKIFIAIKKKKCFRVINDQYSTVPIWLNHICTFYYIVFLYFYDFFIIWTETCWYDTSNDSIPAFCLLFLYFLSLIKNIRNINVEPVLHPTSFVKYQCSINFTRYPMFWKLPKSLPYTP